MANGEKIYAGVLGWPVSHSLSPRLHNFWLRKYDVDGEYIAVPTEPEALTSTVQRLTAEGWAGFNLTIPHKEAVIPLLHVLDESVKRMGAANMVIIRDGKLTGRNSDGYGFWNSIRHRVGKNGKAVMLGAGGASRAVLDALLLNGFKEIIVINRNRERAEALAGGRPEVMIGNWEQRSLLLESADLLINTTSLGMAGKEALEIDLSKLPASALVTDIVYSPLVTPLLAQAIERGNPTVDGLGMLLYQAVPAFHAWFGLQPEVTDELRKHVLSQ